MRGTSSVGAVFTLVAAGVVGMACSGSSGADAPCDPADPTCVCDPTTDPSCPSDGGGDSSGGDSNGDGTRGDSASDIRLDTRTGDSKADSKGDGVVTDSTVTDSTGADTITATDTSTTTDTTTVGDSSCRPSGATCTVSTECCNLDCTAAGTCGSAPTCLGDGTACTAGGSPCCSTLPCSAAGTCTPLSTTCKTTGNPCATNADCCSTYCNATTGACDNGGSFCLQQGDVCSRSGDCCTGFCSMISATVGTCGPPPTGPSFCGGSGVDGARCGSCTDCCSRVCAPYGSTGVTICQRAEGCHITGDLCTKDGDCCGAAGSGVPGDGHVTCDFAGSPVGSIVGICRNPMACNPEGNVCHYIFPTGTTCGVSSARNDCCSHLGAKSNCELDALGVPRCKEAGACVASGGSCAYSGDCCGGLPCVPDSTGALKCSGTTCVALTGSCTTDADCCPGGTCYAPVGSLSGTCNPLPPPPPPPGDAGTDSATDTATTDTAVDETADTAVDETDTGTVADTSTTTDTAPPPPCALYGQTCATDGDCCSGVPCTDIFTGTTCTGANPCSCHYPIH